MKDRRNPVLRWLAVLAAGILLWNGPSLWAQTVTTTVAAGAGPVAVAVNPVTNKIYVANQNSDNVTVIDGATNGTTTLAAGDAPRDVAVNPSLVPAPLLGNWRC